MQSLTLYFRHFHHAASAAKAIDYANGQIDCRIEVRDLLATLDGNPVFGLLTFRPDGGDWTIEIDGVLRCVSAFTFDISADFDLIIETP